MRRGFMVLVMFLALVAFGCDTPAENATEERVEDQQDAAGVDEDVAEERGEAVSEGTLTDTSATVTDTGVTAATDTGVTTGTVSTTTT